MFDRQKEFVTRVTGGRLHRSHYIAIGIGAAITLWFMSGIFNGSGAPTHDLTAAQEDAAASAATRVRVVESVAQMRRGSFIVRGRTSAKRAVQVRAQ